MHKIELYILSGFLGSGKTTLLKKIIKIFNNKNIAILVNEFGKINLDGKVIKTATNMEVKEITNGSIFCNCKSHEFVNGLIELSQHDIDVLVVESSGLSDPTDIGKVLTIVQKQTDEKFIYKGNITLVDPTNFNKLVEVAIPVKYQVENSDLIIINKVDLVSEDEIEKTMKQIKELNPLAEIKRTSYGNLEEQWLSGISPENSMKGADLYRQKLIGTQKILIKFEKNYDLNQVRECLKEVSNYFYRIKGFIKSNNTWYYIDGTNTSVDFKMFDFNPTNAEVVVLASGDMPFKTNFNRVWKNYFDEDVKYI